MDFATLIGQLGPDARDAVSQFYFGDDGVPTYGPNYQPATTGVSGESYSGGGLLGDVIRGVAGDAEQEARAAQFAATGTINPNAYLGDDKEGASRLFADIIRAQTQDYLTRFAPIEDYLASTITRTGTTFLEGDMERTRDAVMGGAQSARDQYTRQFERYGVMGKELDNTNATTSALVGGMNDTRDRDVDRKIALLGGGLGSIGMKSRAQQGTGS
jgi:hypothetical protein